MNHTYTFIMGYLGGTYISQVKAKSNREAMDIWLKELKVEEISNFTEEDRRKLIEDDFEDENPVLIKGMKNVWCICIRTKKGLGSVNFVKTDTTDFENNSCGN